MKLSSEHFAQLKDMILNQAVANENLTEKDSYLSDMRMRWDLLWSVPSSVRTPWFDEVYTYCDDAHIDTALRKIQLFARKEAA